MNEKEELQYLRDQVRKLKQENRELSSKLAVTEASKAETEENLSKIKNSFAWKRLIYWLPQTAISDQIMNSIDIGLIAKAATL